MPSKKPSKSSKKSPVHQRRVDTIETAKKVLDINYKNGYTAPSKVMYPHQWLWDSCFHIIGLRHHRPDRAIGELEILLRGQWPNGMVPNMIFSSSRWFKIFNIWESNHNGNHPDGLNTTAITQSPVIAWAFEKVIKTLPKKDQKATIDRILPKIIKYHQWIYNERDPNQTGRVVIIHPWESIDNDLALMQAMEETINFSKLEQSLIDSPLFRSFYSKFRNDIKYTSPDERSTDTENLMFGKLLWRYRRKNYQIESVLYDKSSFVVEDISFNSILTRSNTSLKKLAKQAKIKLPADLVASMDRTEAAIPDFWDKETEAYVSRNWHTKQPIQVETALGLLPLLNESISKSQAKKLVSKLESDKFATPFPVPTSDATAPDYNPLRYWQGPVWVNLNWMLIEGLKSNGFKKQAQKLTESTIQLVEKNGIWEYYNSQTGAGHGINNFSWTAALYLDLNNG